MCVNKENINVSAFTLNDMTTTLSWPSFKESFEDHVKAGGTITVIYPDESKVVFKTLEDLAKILN
jgi:hypothetical protein